MTEHDFCFWLKGFVELTQGQTPNPAQWNAIKKHLDLMFKKEMPICGASERTEEIGVIDAEILEKNLENWAQALEIYRKGLRPHVFGNVHHTIAL